MEERTLASAFLLYVGCVAAAMEGLKAAESQTSDVIVDPGRESLKNRVWSGVGGGGGRLRPRREEDDRRRAGVTQPENLSDIHSKSNYFGGHLKTGKPDLVPSMLARMIKPRLTEKSS